jgi:hypothetical protein
MQASGDESDRFVPKVWVTQVLRCSHRADWPAGVQPTRAALPTRSYRSVFDDFSLWLLTPVCAL